MGRSPLVLTSRTEHLDYLAGCLNELCPHIFVLKGGMGAKQRKKLAESLAAVPLTLPKITSRRQDHTRLLCIQKLALPTIDSD